MMTGHRVEPWYIAVSHLRNDDGALKGIKQRVEKHVVVEVTPDLYLFNSWEHCARVSAVKYACMCGVCACVHSVLCVEM